MSLGFTRCRAMLSELQFDIRLELLRRRERRALVRLGSAASSSPPKLAAVEGLMEQITAAERSLTALRTALALSLDSDRADFPAVSSPVRLLVVLRGLCTRAILRDQMARVRRGLAPIHAALASALLEISEGRARLPQPAVQVVLRIRGELDHLLKQREARLAPFGGTVLPAWFPHVGAEVRELGRSVWLQLRPNVLPRFPALVGLLAGWWVADTYTSSHLKSVLHSLGIGGGGKRVVDGDAYRAMLFWFPILAAGLFAYLADRAKVMIQSRYVGEK